jgi:hypothetical protein
MRETAVVVMMASPMPMSAWIPAIAGNATVKGEVPETANSIAAAEDPITIESHEETARAKKNPFRLFPRR